MKETKFKALYYLGNWVDSCQLECGIYSSKTPTLYDKDTSIKYLLLQAEMMKDMNGVPFMSQSFFDNLRKCELVDIEINTID